MPSRSARDRLGRFHWSGRVLAGWLAEGVVAEGVVAEGVVAEGVGFEPTMRLTPHSGFQDPLPPSVLMRSRTP